MKVPRKDKVKILEVATAPKAASKPKAMKKSPKAAAVGSTIGSALGSLLPPPFNALASPLLGQLGDWAGDAVGTFLGTGDYEVNSLIDAAQGKTPSRNNGISYVHSQNDEVVFTRREYIGDIISSTTPGQFQISRYRVQATNSILFRYLSGIARLHQQWEPRGIVFQYKSNTGLISNAATPNVGVVVMAMEYDASVVDPFYDKIQMENSWGGCSTATTEHMAFGVECKYNKNVLNNLYCDNDPLNDRETAPSMYDLGTFCVATVGQPAASQNCGELWVSYDIVLSKPKLDRETYGDPRAAQWRMDIAAAGLGANGYLFLEENLEVQNSNYCRYPTENAFTVQVEPPPWLNPSEFTVGSILHFPNMSPGIYQVSLLVGLSTTGVTQQVQPIVNTDRCAIGPLTITTTAGTSLLVGGQDTGSNAFSTPQISATANGNLLSTIFSVEVTDVGPTLSFQGMLPRQVAWTWIVVNSLPPFMTSFPLTRQLREANFSFPFPDSIDPVIDVLVKRSGYKGIPPSVIAESPEATDKRRKAKKRVREDSSLATVSLPDGTQLAVVRDSSGWIVVPQTH